MTDMATAADYVKEYLARRAPFDMPAPWRHRNLLIRALWWKQERWEQSAKLEACASPSAEWDEAMDAMLKAGGKYEAIMREAIDLRRLERAVSHTAITASVAAGAVKLAEVV